jgi:hypothetical protein
MARRLQTLRLAVILISLSVSTLLIGGLRARGFGFDREIVTVQLVCLVFFTPIVAFLLVGMPFRRRCMVALIIASAGVSFAWIHAWAQETRALARYGANPPGQVVVYRWFPYHDEFFLYDPRFGMWHVPD